MNKKILISLSVVGIVAALAIGITTAYFSNTEKSEGNSFIAGAIDLKVDSKCTYNGLPVTSCSWEATDLDDQLFFKFNDVKPGDEGEDTISLHVNTNPAWVCAEISNLVFAENGCNAPEGKVDSTCDIGATGELQNNLYFDIWMDNGEGEHKCNNIKDGDETYIKEDAKVSDLKWAIADSTTAGGPITDTCVGVSWNVPDDVNNIIQGDSITGDISFKAYQSRNNANFKCVEENNGCIPQNTDVMLVLDRSGSIGGAMPTLKTAAHAFVTAMNPTADGTHMGQTSFSTYGTLDQELTGNKALVDTAIDSISPTSLTNLYEGILLANQELASARDRLDATYPDYMIVITDGNPNQPPNETNARNKAATIAATAKAAGVKIYVVGVGSVDANYLRDNIASGPSYYYGVANYSELQAILSQIGTCPGQPVVINGACGSVNGTTVSSAPTENLCSTGTASVVSGTGPWTWTCDGANGGTNDSCSANKTPEQVTIHLNPMAATDSTPMGSTTNLNSTQLDYLTSSNNTRYQSSSNWENNDYIDQDAIDFTFADVIPSGATINSVNLIFEWQRNDNSIDGARLRISGNNGSSWNGTYDISPLPNQNTDATVNLNLLDSYSINTVGEVNDLLIRFQAHDGGGTLVTRHDLVQVDITYTPAP